MLHYSLKRFLLSIPALWFLITLVFLLSRLLPGSYGSESILYGEGATLTKSTQQQRDNTYKAYLDKTGQNLPAFYFSISTQASPNLQIDEFVQESKLPEQLAWRYGDADKALTYHAALQHLESKLKQENATSHLITVDKLQQSIHPDTILFYSKALATQVTTGEAESYALALQNLASELTAAENKFLFLLPTLHWHGTQNQYHRWFFSLLKGDMGTSYRDARPVATILWEAIANTFWITLISLVLVFFLALELSIRMVQKTSINWHKILLPFLYVLDSVPLFVLSLILLILFATPDFLTLFPVFGLGSYADQEATWLEQLYQTGPYLVLPITCLVLANLPYLTNQTYRSLSDTMQANYIRTARAKGLKERSIIRWHAIRNALLPVITVLSDFLPALVAGSVIIETIFAIPGIGRLLISSVLARDFPVILGIVLLVALVKMLSHFVADLCYAQADPRVRKGVPA